MCRAARVSRCACLCSTGCRVHHQKRGEQAWHSSSLFSVPRGTPGQFILWQHVQFKALLLLQWGRPSCSSMTRCVGRRPPFLAAACSTHQCLTTSPSSCRESQLQHHLCSGPFDACSWLGTRIGQCLWQGGKMVREGVTVHHADTEQRVSLLCSSQAPCRPFESPTMPYWRIGQCIQCR